MAGAEIDNARGDDATRRMKSTAAIVAAPPTSPRYDDRIGQVVS
jgi:hypothetical protein